MVIVTVCVIVQVLLSVIVTTYVPALRPDADGPLPPEGDHEYVYVPVPPVTVTVAEPFGFPQVAGVVAEVALSAGGCVIVNVRVTVQLGFEASATVTT